MDERKEPTARLFHAKGGFRMRPLPQRGRMTRLAAGAGAVLLALALTACGSTPAASTPPAKLGPVTFGVVAPLTGSMAQLGFFISSPCYAAADVINAAGGINGGKVSCSAIDDTGDAADAVPNVERALTQTKNLDAMFGIDSSVAATIVPIISNAKIPMVSSNGLTVFNTQTSYPYYWRLTPPDNAQGAAMGLFAAKKGYTKVAVLIANDTSDMGQGAGIPPALQKAGITTVNANTTIAPDQSSYQSVVLGLVHASPDAILVSADAQTVTTIVSEYAQLNNGTVPPVITVTADEGPQLQAALTHAVNATYAGSDVYYVGGYLDQSTPAFAPYHAAMAASGKLTAQQASVVTTIGPIGSLYDGMMVLALAMDAAHSDKGSVYDKYVTQVTTAGHGAVVVHTYAQGVKDLKAGRKIAYVGVTGPIVFDKYHNSPGEFAVFTYPGGTPTSQAVITAAEIQSALH